MAGQHYNLPRGPLASATSGLEFGRLSTEEIRQISVKRIHATPGMDTMLNPVPGGLYDPALGAITALRRNCGTCKLGPEHCSGHCGHIELPVDCYHPLFIDTTLRLLRASCVYCHHFRLKRYDINKVQCELRLLQYGMIDEMRRMRAIVSMKETVEKDGTIEEEDEEAVMDMREAFVKKAVRKFTKQDKNTRALLMHNPAAVQVMKQIMGEFIKAASNGKACARCQGISPTYRKDRAVKIFRKPLTEKAREKMRVMEKKMVNPLIFLQQQEQARKERDDPKDKMLNGMHPGDETESEDEEVLEHGAEDEIALQNAVETTAQAKNSQLEDEEEQQAYMTPTEVRAALTLLFERESEMIKLLFSSGRGNVTTDMFFLRTILVPPNRYRPLAKGGNDNKLMEGQQNESFNKVIKAVLELRQIQRSFHQPPNGVRRHLGEQIQAAVTLQEQVNNLIDRPADAVAMRAGPSGIKQILEKKEGIFRMNMMGKRVNYAARSVISPDPNIETNEIGVPLVFAKRLTYPEPVTTANFDALSRAVINGPDKWPGAVYIQNEKGQIMHLRFKSVEQRKGLAKQLMTCTAPGAKGDHGKVVMRHLQTGDMVIMNRQPTLHKPSMMAHKAKVLTNQKTIRMHYANCNTYNADFDGDEMNMHFPQSELARAEATQIADTDHQYLSATSGKPLRGLIQDHISMGVQFTSRDTFFDREQYQELLYNCMRPEENHTVFTRIETVPPAIIKPKQLWTGKQVITTILKNITPPGLDGINLTSKSSTASESWGEVTVKDSEKFVVTADKVAFRDTEQVVIFKDGHHLSGILDKGQMGPAAGGVVHSVHELYGHTAAGRLLSVLGRLLTRFLNERAWSCGMDDLYLTKQGDNQRRQELSKAKRIGLEVATEYVSLKPEDTRQESSVLHRRLENVLRNDEQLNGLDQVYKSKVKTVTDAVSKACMPAGLAKPFPRNQMQAMTISGAKGSSVNANLISCNLGQQVLEGRRVPVMVSGKTLPSFQAFETDPGAGGYVRGRFLTGIKPHEYFFHAMSGREGLIDTAVKTAKSGYLQRCVIKGLEGAKVEYDTSVREASTGSVVQFLYGEDGLEVARQKHLKEFTFLVENHSTVSNMLRSQEVIHALEKNNVAQAQKELLRIARRGWPVSEAGQHQPSGKPAVPREIELDPILAKFSPSSHIGSTSESFTNAVLRYSKDNPDKLLKDKKQNPDGIISKKHFATLMDLKYLRSLVDPGEAVGVVAAQSIGEPSTQMTLNTFHLAGHSAKNVTLGIPRLREIIMTASANIMTPTMSCKPIEESSVDEATRFAKGISKIALADVMKELSVTERSDSGKGYENERIYDISMLMYDAKEYKEEYNVKAEDVLRTIEEKFMPNLDRLIKAEVKRKGDEELLKDSKGAQPEIGTAVGRNEEARPTRKTTDGEGGEEGGDDDIDVDDARDTAQSQRRGDTYADPDDDEREIEKQWDHEDADIDDDEDETAETPQQTGTNTPADDPNDPNATTNTTTFEAHLSTTTRDTASRLKRKFPHLLKFSFSASSLKPTRLILSYSPHMAKLLLLPLLETACRTSHIQQIPGVNQCQLFFEEVKGPDGKIVKRIDPKTGLEEDEKEMVLTTQGVNLVALREFQDVISPHSITTNSVSDMLKWYGVEAARNTIIREISAVFAGHGIAVDNRHVNLIADAMTQSGAYKPFSRNGVVRESGSVLAKMSFETVMGVLRDAVLSGEGDALMGPSARIVTGRRGMMGTGSFDVVMPV